jgi:hypothetical protein
MGGTDPDLAGWHYLYAPKAGVLKQEWDHCFRAGRTDASFLEDLPDLEDLRAVYRWILNGMPKGGISMVKLYRNLKANGDFSLERGLIALWIFLDVGFFVRAGDQLNRVNQIQKINLAQHPLMQKIKQIKNEKSH